MKFKVSQVDFSEALSACEKSLFAKASLPILSNILLSVEKNKLEILSTNLETATKVSVPCKGGVDGKITLPGRVLTEFVSQLSEGEIAVERLGEEIVVAAGGNSARLAKMPPEEFPAIPKIESGREIRASARDLADCIRKVEFCAASDEARPVLSGVLISCEKKRISAVATDGYRLSFMATKAQEEMPALKIIVPAKNLREVAKIIGENLGDPEKETVTMVVGDDLNQVNFRVANIEFTSRLIEGEFPAWQKIIPNTFPTKIRISKSTLARQVRIASIFARDSGNIVKLKFEGKNLAISATTSQVGAHEAQVVLEAMEGAGGEIAFNFRYLLDALSVIDDEEVYFEMIESLAPGRLTGAGGGSEFFHIIMPVRLQS
ncbi:DNA polymerase III subunit beta [Candidatus Curtissbacteria bacterium]|nr:DNA polymerase III subunit beta [Candidatus Curtissbacteria bacterium]